MLFGFMSLHLVRSLLSMAKAFTVMDWCGHAGVNVMGSQNPIMAAYNGLSVRPSQMTIGFDLEFGAFSKRALFL